MKKLIIALVLMVSMPAQAADVKVLGNHSNLDVLCIEGYVVLIYSVGGLQSIPVVKQMLNLQGKPLVCRRSSE